MLDIPVRVKDALRDGRLLKEYEILILDDEGAIEDTIDNNNLVYESVHINEKLCSGYVLKFGLCEGSSIEFEYFGKPDILGKRIHVLLHVQYKNDQDVLAWYHHISMGFFTVEKCPRQFSTGIYKATAYNKLQSNYLDAKANDYLIETYNALANDQYISNVTVDLILRGALENYAIDNVTEYKCSWSSGHAAYTYTRTTSEYGLPLFYITGVETINRNGAPNTGYSRIKVKGLSTLRDIVHEYWPSTGNFYFKITGERSGGSSYAYEIDASSDDEMESPIIENLTGVSIYIPGTIGLGSDPDARTPDQQDIDRSKERADSIMQAWIDSGDCDIRILHQVTGGLGETVVSSAIESWPDVTLRELQSAVFESQCQYGQLDRKTDLFIGIELNKSALYPADALYPAADLYPGGTRERTVKSGYSKLWSESGNVQSWRYLIITYKGLDSNNQEVEKTLQRTINANGTTDYNMSDNWLFKNLVWSDSDVSDYADAMALKMQDVTWFPFEMWGAGLPYLETGDQIEVVDNTGETYTSYVLSRQLDGIQNLQDTLMNGTLDIF